MMALFLISIALAIFAAVKQLMAMGCSQIFLLSDESLVGATLDTLRTVYVFFC